MRKHDLILIMGGPASGKGTTCAFLSQKYDQVFHISVGDLLREKKDLDPKLAEMMKNGALLPVSVVGNVILSHIKEKCDTNKIILLDGFPRSQDNYDYFCGEMSEFINLVGILVIDCDDETMVERAVNRGGQSGRTDDNAQTCRRRIKIYHDETEKIIGLFDKKLITRVSGLEKDTNATREKIVTTFEFDKL